MNYNICPLYSLKSKKTLMKLLGINNKHFFKQEYIINHIFPRVDGRLIEAPCDELKRIQTRIKNYLNMLEFPKEVFSGVKQRSYINNAELHVGQKLRRLYKIDLTAFFPSISRDTVYRFFKNDMNCSPDVSTILTNLTTVDLSKSSSKNMGDVHEFLRKKGVSCYNHLISGSPCSQILSYLVNQPMFHEIERLAIANNITMSIYVDDVTFSSESRISQTFKKQIYEITKKYVYKISEKKVKFYTKKYPKLITGVVISKSGNLTIRNAMRYNIITEFKKLQQNPSDDHCRKRLRGLLIAAKQVDSNAFPTIYKYAFEKFSE